MRRIIPILLAVIVLISCDKKEDPKPATIVGKWEITNADIEFTVDGKPAKQYLIDNGMSEADAQAAVDELESDFDTSSIEGTFEFKSDGTWVGTSDGDTETGTWKLSDDGKTLTLGDPSNPADNGTGTVTKLTDTELVFELAQALDDDIPLEIKIIFSLKRI